MKRLTTLYLLIVSFSPVFAQYNFDQKLVEAYQKEAGDHAALFYAPLEQPFNVTKWANHPFWGTMEGVNGTVCFDGIIYNNVTMRFNIAEQQLCVAASESSILVTPDMSKIAYFTLDGKRCERINGIFACLEYSNDNGIEFWNAKKRIKGRDVLKDRHSYYSYQEINYYYIKKDGVMNQVKKAKEIAKLFPAQEKMLIKQLRRADYSIQGDKLNSMLFILQNLPAKR